MLLRELSAAVRRLQLGDRSVLVAASGGLDSCVLAHGLAELADRHGLRVVLGHVNHGLRGAQSEADQESVGELAGRLGVPWAAERVEPERLREGRGSRERPTLQEAARELRYRALRRLADRLGASRLATAHHADDQAETVMLRLLRGTGPDGLAGIPERSADGCLVRPLLRVPRAEIERYARERRIVWREDASNRDERFARNRLRERWLPGLARDFNPRLLRALADLAEAQQRDSEWLAGMVEREAQARIASEGGWLRIDALDWRALPPALSRRLVRLAMERCGAGRHVTRTHLERACAYLGGGRSGSQIELPGGVRLRRDRDGYRMGPVRSEPA